MIWDSVSNGLYPPPPSPGGTGLLVLTSTVVHRDGRTRRLGE
jgi:hypothetical protein